MSDTAELVERLRSYSRTELNTPGDYARGWNAAKFNIKQDARKAAAKLEAAEASLARMREALEEAEKVIAPFAAKSKQFDDACDAMGHPRADDQYHPKTDFTHGHLRAARKWMETRPSPPKEG